MFKSKGWLSAGMSFVLILAGIGFLSAAQVGPGMTRGVPAREWGRPWIRKECPGCNRSSGGLI